MHKMKPEVKNNGEKEAGTGSKAGGWLDNLVFFTVQDALQVLPGEETD